MILCACLAAPAQNSHLLRLYEDNDFINITGNGTDKGYTNGTRLDYFFRKQRPSRFFIDSWFPRAGADAVNTFSYSLTQVMLVPNDISKPQPDKNDWPYSGALFLSHGLHSSNAAGKFALQAEIVAGVIGPLSLAKQAQTWVHRMIGYTTPMGWHYQMPNDVLLNVNMLAEKMIWQPGKAFELIGGAQIQAGTMLDGASVYTLLRAGNISPWFNGYLEQFSSPANKGRRLQYYIYLRPALQWSAYTALLEGGVFSGKNDYYAGIGNKGSSPSPHKITAAMDAGIVLAAGHISLSFSQKEWSPLLDGVSHPTTGNISVTFAS